MNLWIRSQDKTILINVKNLLIDEKQKKIYTVETLSNATHQAVLGTYNSKERTLEVLDEINNAVLGIISLEDIEEQGIKEYTGNAILSKQSNSIVYEMPEE